MSTTFIDNEIETEANMFAMELLMPTQFVKDYVAKHGPIDLTEDKYLKDMAKAFGVNQSMMAFRVGQVFHGNRA